MGFDFARFQEAAAGAAQYDRKEYLIAEVLPALLRDETLYVENIAWDRFCAEDVEDLERILARHLEQMLRGEKLAELPPVPGRRRRLGP